ncbi:LacI family DNA-binding transcriptional regulator [Georgenia sp. SYP-B2076]|uniref:LacI family DNA-binding transcriptional regulator n=1 Tax=Georgenia sp. SYP-B2076 TaxID=2495881 RepID=UPI001F0B9D37|nr:LacI family DNA-binding transcriptional regulator [Georgenia sp. SYP-B2076]
MEPIPGPRTARVGAPSMADVAAVAGVSHQTVSRVLNNPDAVRPDTRERVLVAIRALGYRRNPAARALVTRRTRLIGVINPGEARFGPANTTIAIEEAAREAGYATTLTIMRDARHETVEAALEYFLGLGVDGIVVIAARTHVAAAADELAGRLPVVMVAAGLQATASLHVVAVDQELGARMATRHLIGLGHREVVHVSGPNDWFDARARVAGWRKEMREAGLEVSALVAGGWDAAQGYEVARRMARDRRLPGAVFAANDQMALGMLRAFQEAGVRVPEDVSVVGFDDVAGSEFFSPPLTTVRQPFAAVGRRCIEVILGALDGRSPSTTLIPPELVVRSSAARPAPTRADPPQ